MRDSDAAAMAPGVHQRVLRAACVAAVLCVAVVLAGLFTMVAPHKAYADFTVSTGYEGGPFYTKQVFSDADMRAMSDGKTYQYSTVDKNYSLRKGFGKGVYLDVLFNTAGVTGALSGFNLKTDDSYAPSSSMWSYANLIQTPRFYYPGFAQYYDFDNGYWPTEWIETIESQAVQVPTIIAYESSFQRVDSPDDPTWDNKALMTTSDGYRMMFGESTLGELEAGGFAHGAYELQCILAGAPTITFTGDAVHADENGGLYISGEVGSTVNLVPVINASDATVAQQGVHDVTWTVEGTEANGNAVQVPWTQRDDGSIDVQIVSEGTLMVRASFSGAEGSIGGTGTAKQDPEPEPPAPDNPEPENPNGPDEEGTVLPQPEPEAPKGDGPGAGSGEGGTGGAGDAGGWAQGEVSGSGTGEGTSNLPEGAQLATVGATTDAGEVGSPEESAAPVMSDEVGLGSAIGGGEASPTVQKLDLTSDAIQVKARQPWWYAAMFGALALLGVLWRVGTYNQAKDKFAKIKKEGLWNHSATV